MLDEVVGLCGFVAASPVAVWVAVKYCCSVCSVLLGCFSVACHVVMLLAPLATPAVALLRVHSPVLCASPHFEQVALAGGLFRTVSHTPFVSIGNAAQ